MPSGIILSSGSQGATQEAIEKVLADNGYEAEKPAVEAVELVAPKAEDFKSDEEFEAAQEEFEAKQEEQEEAKAAEADKKDEPAGRRPSRRQRAIDKATKDLQQKTRQLEDELAQLKGKKAAAAEEPAAKLEPPKREAFKSDEEFEEAKFDYRYQQRRLKEASDQTRSEQANRLKENYENYQAGVAEFKEEHDDWDEVVDQKIPVQESVYLTIHELENGPAVTYYLGKHPAFAKKLAEMSPLAAVVEVGRLADRLKTGAPNRGEADGAAPRKPRPKLPEPVRPVSTAATSSSLTSSEAAKNRDFRAFKRAQRAGR